MISWLRDSVDSARIGMALWMRRVADRLDGSEPRSDRYELTLYPEGWAENRHAEDVPKPDPCRNCGCPWDSCLIHNEFCCDACSHPDGPR